MPNFGSIRVANIPFYKKASFDFQKHPITVVSGKNMNAPGSTNAAGKSFFFLQVREFIHGSDTVQDRLKTGAREMQWSKGNCSYRAVKSFKKGKQRVTVKERVGNGEWTDLGIREMSVANKFIQDSFGFTEAEFDSLVYLDVRPHPLISGTTAARKAFFTKFFRLDAQDDLVKSVNLQLRAAEKARIELNVLESQLADATSGNATDVNALRSQLDKTRREVVRVKGEMEKARKVSTLVHTLEQYEKRLPTLTRLCGSHLENYESVLAELSNRRTAANRLLKRAQKDQRVQEQRQELRQSVRKLKEQIADLPDTTDDLPLQQSQLKLLRSKLEAAQSTVDELRYQKRSLEQTVQQRSHCDKCGQPLSNSDEVRRTRVKAKADLKLVIGKLTKQATNLESLRKWIRDLEVAVESTTSSSHKRTSLVDKLAAEKDRLTNLPLVDNVDVDVLTEAAERADGAYNKLAKYQDAVPSLVQALALSDSDVESVRALDSLLGRYEKLSSRIASVEAEIQIHQDAQQRVKSLTAKVAEAKQLSKDEEPLRLLSEALSKKGGVRSEQIRAICSRLEQLVNKYTPILFPEDYHFTFDLSTQFNILAHRRTAGGKEVVSDVRRLSVSESKFFALVLVMALTAFVPNDRRSNLLILDEPSSNMGESMVERLVRFLPVLNQAIPHIIFITPHNSVLDIASQEGIPVAHYEAVKRGDESRLMYRSG